MTESQFNALAQLLQLRDGPAQESARLVLVAGLLDCPVPANRVNVILGDNDWLLVAQYAVPRMPEGATTLPDGASIQFWVVMGGE